MMQFSYNERCRSDESLVNDSELDEIVSAIDRMIKWHAVNKKAGLPSPHKMFLSTYPEQSDIAAVRFDMDVELLAFKLICVIEKFIAQKLNTERMLLA